MVQDAQAEPEISIYLSKGQNMTRRNRCKAKLRLYPDPILKAVCEPVGDDEDVSGIIRDMMYILTNSKTGVGLAAPQAGHKKRVIIIKRGESYLTLINPLIIDNSGIKVPAKERCLSYPHTLKTIYRYDGIIVEYNDDEADAERDIFTGWDARIIQHEIDHLNGKCKIGE